jgi:hypothetical protein
VTDEYDLGEIVSLSLVESARLLGGYSWIESRLFEVMGGWVSNESDPEARLLFDAQSTYHAWHAELLSDLLPKVSGLMELEGVTDAPSEGTEVLLATLGSNAGELGGGTLVRLVGMARVVSPRLVCGYAYHLRRAAQVSDAPVVRALRLVVADEMDAWREAESMVQGLIRRPHDVAVVTAHQQYLEALVAGTGPGLVAWPGRFVL